MAPAPMRSDSTATLDEAFEPHALSPLKEEFGAENGVKSASVQPTDSVQSTDSVQPIQSIEPILSSRPDSKESIRSPEPASNSNPSAALPTLQAKLMNQLTDLSDENKRLKSLLQDVQGKMEKQSEVTKSGMSRPRTHARLDYS